MIPFSRRELFAVFADYNASVWPSQLILYGLATAMVVTACRNRETPSRWPPVALGLLWSWSGVAYHWWKFTTINPLAWVFGALFLIAGAQFIIAGVRGRLEFGRPAGWKGWTGGLLIAYALVLYPLLGIAAHPAREVPVLGVPCPTTIFTFGLLFWSRSSVPRHLLLIPSIWALIGSTAAFFLGVPQDLGLLAAVFLGLLLLREADGGRRADSNPEDRALSRQR